MTEKTTQPVEPSEPEKPAEGEQPADETTEPVAAESTETPEGGEPAAEPQAEGEPTEAPKEDEKHRRAGGWQRKIEKLERENAAKDALLQQLTQQLPKPAANQDKPKDPTAQLDDYIGSMVEQRLAAERARAEQSRFVADFQKRVGEVRAAHADFDEVMAGADDAPLPPALHEALLTSEQGPAIMYQLAKNPAELDRLRSLPPLIAVRELGRLEAKLTSVTATPKPAAKPVARKPAPAPISPVTARGPTTVKPVSQMSQEEYNAWRDSQRKR